MPGCVVYAGTGWSKGILHTLEGSRYAVNCLPEQPHLKRTKGTLELNHVIGAVFGLWDRVLPHHRIRNPNQLQLPGLAKAAGRKRKKVKVS